jgi:thiol-disulfide isomerase/thioredoxin
MTPVRALLVVVAAAAVFVPVVQGSAGSALPAGARTAPLRVIWPRASTWSRPARALVARHALTLASLRGHAFVLNFFASWCDACRSEARLLKAASQRNHGRVLFLGAAVNDTRSDARRFLRAHEVPFPAVVAGSPVVRSFRLIGLPETVFVDARGRVRMTRAGTLTAGSLASGLSSLGR